MSSIIVVDDNSDIRDLVTILINAAEGLEVVGQAATGREALQVWAAAQPDVIVLDHTMPDLSGLEVARVILAERPGQPIVMFTANASDPELGSALASGVYAVLSKERVGALVPTIRWCCPRAREAGGGGFEFNADSGEGRPRPPSLPIQGADRPAPPRGEQARARSESGREQQDSVLVDFRRQPAPCRP